MRDILEGLINQINEDKDGKGLSILVLWNNQLTSKSSPYFARIIVCNFLHHYNCPYIGYGVITIFYISICNTHTFMFFMSLGTV